MRLIDADALSQEIESLRVTVSGRPATLDDAKSDVLRVIDEQKTVDAAPVVPGQWVGSGDGYADGELVYDMWACSECGYDADGADEKPQWRFYPCCGAKMDGGDDLCLST